MYYLLPNYLRHARKVHKNRNMRIHRKPLWHQTPQKKHFQRGHRIKNNDTLKGFLLKEPILYLRQAKSLTIAFPKIKVTLGSSQVKPCKDLSNPWSSPLPPLSKKSNNLFNILYSVSS